MQKWNFTALVYLQFIFLLMIIQKIDKEYKREVFFISFGNGESRKARKIVVK